MNVNAKGYLASATPEWSYPEAGDPPAPLGTTIQLLNSGGASTKGQWTDESNFIAWAPLLKRNKDKERLIAEKGKK
jgi:hypothetical protein